MGFEHCTMMELLEMPFWLYQTKHVDTEEEY